VILLTRCKAGSSSPSSSITPQAISPRPSKQSSHYTIQTSSPALHPLVPAVTAPETMAWRDFQSFQCTREACAQLRSGNLSFSHSTSWVLYSGASFLCSQLGFERSHVSVLWSVGGEPGVHLRVRCRGSEFQLTSW
jgi:hypothetical protein